MVRMTIIVMVLSAAIGLTAQDIFSEPFNLSGVRAASMGRAATALVNDVSAIYWNPAAMGQDSAGQIGVMMRYAARYFTDADGIRPPLENWDINSGSQVDFGFIGLVFPFSGGSDNTHLGLAVQKFRPLIPWREETITLQDAAPYRHRFENSGGIYLLSAAVSVDVLNDLSLGGAYNFYSGEIRSSFQSGDSGEESVQKYQNVEKYSRTSLNLGGRYVPDQAWIFGLNLQIPFILECKQTLQISDSDQQTNYTEVFFPLWFTAGAVWNGLKNTRLTADFFYRPWHKISVKEGKEKSSFTGLSLHAIHLGAEYRQQQNGLQLFYRGGYYTNPTLMRDQDGRQITVHVLTAGLGLKRESVAINLGLEWGFSSSPSGLLISSFVADDLQISGPVFNRHDLQLSLELLIDLR